MELGCKKRIGGLFQLVRHHRKKREDLNGFDLSGTSQTDSNGQGAESVLLLNLTYKSRHNGLAGWMISMPSQVNTLGENYCKQCRVPEEFTL